MDYGLLFLYILPEYSYTKADTENEVKKEVAASCLLATQNVFICGEKKCVL